MSKKFSISLILYTSKHKPKVIDKKEAKSDDTSHAILLVQDSS